MASVQWTIMQVVINQRHYASFAACIVVLAALAGMNFSSRGSPSSDPQEHPSTVTSPSIAEEHDSQHPSHSTMFGRAVAIDEEALPKLVGKLPTSPSFLRIDVSSPGDANGDDDGEDDVREVSFSGPKLPEKAEDGSACCCYISTGVASLSVYQNEDEDEHREYIQGSVETSDHLTEHLGQKGVDVLYKVKHSRSDKDSSNSSSSSGSRIHPHSTFVPLSSLPKGKCPHKSKVRVFVEMATKYDVRLDAESCVRKKGGCGYMQLRVEEDHMKCADDTETSAPEDLKGVWITECNEVHDAKHPKLPRGEQQQLSTFDVQRHVHEQRQSQS